MPRIQDGQSNMADTKYKILNALFDKFSSLKYQLSFPINFVEAESESGRSFFNMLGFWDILTLKCDKRSFSTVFY